MRIRNKLTFKRLRKETLVYDYCKEKIKKGETFTILDIAKDLKMGRTSVIEYLQEISNRYNDITYSGGVITLIGVGNSIGKENTKNNEVLTIKKLPRTTRGRIEKQNRVYEYLCELINNNQEIPNLSILSEHFKNEMHLTTVMYLLKNLDKEGKIIYRKGKVIAVNVPNIKAEKERIIKYNHTEENHTEEVKDEVKEKLTTLSKDIVEHIGVDIETYNKAVKDLIAEYILNANITTRDEIIQYVDTLMKITDKLKEKLYKE